jgi:Copper resistance protein K
MKRKLNSLIALLVGIGVGTFVFAQGRHDEKPHGVMNPGTAPAAGAVSVAPRDSTEQAIALKDGGTLILRKDGTMYHADAAGKRVRMKDGVVMEAKDGTRYMMKSDAVWKQITEKGTMHPNHP